MSSAVTLIPGDGIGPSITAATVRVLEAVGADIQWDVQVAGMAAVAKHGDPIPDSTLDSIKRTRVALKGPLDTPIYTNPSPIGVSSGPLSATRVRLIESSVLSGIGSPCFATAAIPAT